MLNYLFFRLEIEHLVFWKTEKKVPVLNKTTTLPSDEEEFAKSISLPTKVNTLVISDAYK